MTDYCYLRTNHEASYTLLYGSSALSVRALEDRNLVCVLQWKYLAPPSEVVIIYRIISLSKAKGRHRNGYDVSELPICSTFCSPVVARKWSRCSSS